jgi:hypothetical protein
VSNTKPLRESKRPRRRASEQIRAFFGCPFCLASDAMTGQDTLHVVAYRFRTIRVECQNCGGRFSFDALQVADAMMKHLPRADEGRPDFPASMAHQIAGAVYAGYLRDRGANRPRQSAPSFSATESSTTSSRRGRDPPTTVHPTFRDFQGGPVASASPRLRSLG